MSSPIDMRELRAALARKGMAQWMLAATLGISPSTFSAYIHDRLDAPSDLARRIALILGVSESALCARALEPGEAHTSE